MTRGGARVARGSKELPVEFWLEIGPLLTRRQLNSTPQRFAVKIQPLVAAGLLENRGRRKACGTCSFKLEFLRH